MTYIDRVACALYALVWEEGDPRTMPSNDALCFRIYGVLALSKGEATTLEDVHHAWAAWCVNDRPYHVDLIPFAELTKEQQERDRKYMDAIHEVSRQIDRRPSAFR